MDFDPKKFLDSLTTEVEKLGIDLSTATLDHIAYQTSSSNEYDELKSVFNKFSQQVKEAIVAERRVGVYKYTNPPIYKGQPIQAIELIEPVKDQICLSGFEHAEYLLPMSLEEFIKQYPDIDWNTDALNREEFPMLILRLSETMRVKFPRKSILIQQ